MKILFWILAILSIPVGMFMSVVSVFADGLDLNSTIIGKCICLLGALSVIASIVCLVLGIKKLRKGNVKKAVVLALAGLAYSGVILAGMYIDEAVGTVLFEKDLAERNEEMFGEGWNDAPAIEGIPAQYQEELNKFYAVVRDTWSSEQLAYMGAISMAEHYGDAPLDNIGFLLMDMSGDGIDELLIGTTAPVEEGGTAIFYMYSNPENLFHTLTSAESETYYLHSGETDNVYLAEIDGMDAACVLAPVEGETIIECTYQEGAMDPAGRLTLEMIPFSQYK